MDTREKIVPLNALVSRLDEGPWVAVAGRFDPLTLTQANRLSALADGHALAAIVEPGTESLLTVEARAALLAALKSVRLVAIAETADWREVFQAKPKIKVVEDAEGEQRRSAEFVQFIAQRQGAR